MTGKEITCLASPPLPGMPDDGMRAEVGRIAAMLVEEGGELMLPALPDADLQRRLRSRVMELDRVNAPAGPIPRDWRGDRACQAIAAMMMGFIGSRRDLNADELVLAYRAHLSELPVAAIERACSDLARRKVKDAPVDYLPSSARVFEAAERRAEASRGERYEIEKIFRAKALPKPMSPDQQREARAKLKALAERMAKENEVLVSEESEAAIERRVATGLAQIEREWDALGLQPIESGGKPMSVALARKMRPDYFHAVDRKRRRAW